MTGFFPVKSSMGGTRKPTAETPQNPRTVNLSTLSTSFMAISDGAARLSSTQEFWCGLGTNEWV